MRRIPITQICRRNGFCQEHKMCSPTLRVCEKNAYNTALFQLLEDALNDPAHPLHKKAMENYPFIEIKDVPTTPVKLNSVPMETKPIELNFVPIHQLFNLEP